MSFLTLTSPRNRRYGAALWAGFCGGNIASFVKWGVENPFPPRTPERAIPPAEMLHDLGMTAQTMVFNYSGHVINWGVAGIHHLFSIVFALLYCGLAEILPAIKYWQGIGFGLVITFMFHGVVLPVCHWAPPIWNLPAAELVSETLGHLAWMWTIEVFRRDLRNRSTGLPDATG